MSDILGKIPKKLPTPFYVYDLDRVAKQFDCLKSALPANTDIHYAMKANSNRDILKFLRTKGAGVDTVSGGEIQRALETGFKPDQILFAGVGKTRDELTLALKKKIKLINVESLEELATLGALAKKLKARASVGFRLNPDVDSKTHPYISTGAKINKFGMPLAILPQLKDVLKKFKNHLELQAVYFHIGSQLVYLEPLEEAVKIILPVFHQLRSEGFPLKYFDIGGGIGVRYKDEKTIDIDEYGKMVHRCLGRLDARILTEPGRFLVGECGILVTDVLYTKPGPEKIFAIVDTGMHHLMRPSLYGAYHEVVPLKKRAGDLKNYEIVGPICESSDVLAKDRSLNELKQGDRLAILTAGAYGFSMANNYNLHPLPKEYLLSKGKVRLSRG